MAGKVKSLDGIIRTSDLETILLKEREATQEFVKVALGEFYQYLLENGHLRATEKLDNEVRAMVDSGELKPERPRIVYGEAG